MIIKIKIINYLRYIQNLYKIYTKFIQKLSNNVTDYLSVNVNEFKILNERI